MVRAEREHLNRFEPTPAGIGRAGRRLVIIRRSASKHEIAVVPIEWSNAVAEIAADKDIITAGYFRGYSRTDHPAALIGWCAPREREVA